ncbi:hypothetical protein D3C87_80690 [compost metagenome]
MEDGIFLYKDRLVERFGFSFFYVLNYDSDRDEFDYSSQVRIDQEDFSRLVRMPIDFEILLHYI